MGKIENAVQWALNIANDNSHGYDQINGYCYGNLCIYGR